jgi:hypothetical protein
VTKIAAQQIANANASHRALHLKGTHLNVGKSAAISTITIEPRS